MKPLDLRRNLAHRLPRTNIVPWHKLFLEILRMSDELDTGREVEFGHKLLKDHFSLRKDKVNLNHGSFGAVPKVVMTTHIANLTEQESFPEMWFREGIYKVISCSRQAIADLVNANVEEIVLVENASYAVNSILRSYPFKVEIMIKLLL